MKKVFDQLPGWSFEIDEVSAGVYEVTATDAQGHRVQAKGTDYDALLNECRVSAARISVQPGTTGS
ncbi:MAG TPA: hypothetical protein VGY54_04955 [Polyangiaceae bacterium]|jgi:hypothetical protein|nr:hypothetical protein [Polyangiaceae bacterium]